MDSSDSEKDSDSNASPSKTVSGIRKRKIDFQENLKDAEKKKKKAAPARNKFLHYFQESWKTEYHWVRKSNKGSGYFLCAVCNKDLRCKMDEKTSLRRHSLTAHHKTKEASCLSLKDGRGSLVNLCKKSENLFTQVKENEVRYAMFFIEHNIAFDVADHLMDLIKSFDKNSPVLQKMTGDRTKVTKLVTNVVGEFSFNELVNYLKLNNFSIMVDESTDVGTKKNLAITVRYMRDGRVTDDFLALLEVTDGTARGLYKLIKSFFKQHGIPLSNLVGFTVDGASVMFGSQNSVWSHLKKKVPDLIAMRCICHSLALCSSYACSKIPKDVEKLITDVYCYFKYSSVRTQKLEGIQKLLELPVRKLLRLHKVRWLSLHSVVNRFIELYDSVFQYMQKEKDNDEDAKNIYNRMLNHFNLLYLKFLQFILPIVNSLNVEFQSEKPKLHLLYEQMKTTFELIGSFYLKSDYLEKTDITALQFADPSNFVALEKMDLGPMVKLELSRMVSRHSPAAIRNFQTNCLNFLVELMKQIYQRFPFDKPEVQLLEDISFIDPANLKLKNDISLIAHAFHLDVADVYVEYQLLKRIFKNNTEEDA